VAIFGKTLVWRRKHLGTIGGQFSVETDLNFQKICAKVQNGQCPLAQTLVGVGGIKILKSRVPSESNSYPEFWKNSGKI